MRSSSTALRRVGPPALLPSILFILLIALAAVPLAVRAAAADGTAGDALSAETSAAITSQADTGLQQIVVTATRTEQPLDKTGSSTSVISGADITTQQLVTVSSALGELPGISILRTGGPGQDTSIYLRGAAPGETLLLLDGIRINDPSTPDGEAVLGELLVNNIARIEVLRGPQSTLYGSDAMGGVVNIITRRGGSQPLTAQLLGEGGSYGTWRANAAANGTGRAARIWRRFQ